MSFKADLYRLESNTDSYVREAQHVQCMFRKQAKTHTHNLVIQLNKKTLYEEPVGGGTEMKCDPETRSVIWICETPPSPLMCLMLDR
jgi:hypothetical protein